MSATLLLTFGVSGLNAPLAGILGDRFDRSRVMILSDLRAGAGKAYDAIVVGGHNGLVAAAYLAKAGARVVIQDLFGRTDGPPILIMQRDGGGRHPRRRLLDWVDR